MVGANIVGNWSPALQIRTILLSIQALLGAPNPDDPLANDVAQRWKEDEPSAISTGTISKYLIKYVDKILMIIQLESGRRLMLNRV